MNRQQKRANEKEFYKTKAHRVKKNIRKVLKELEEEKHRNYSDKFLEEIQGKLNN